ncbi:MAG: hypothetical protein ABI626_07410 [Sphingomicrobium sp.]
MAILSAAFWIHYLLLNDVLGPLTVDEIYFAHVFWLIRDGLQPYSDFYSTHLPAYFNILGLLVPPAPATDLSFVWTLRAVVAAVIAVYVLLLFKLSRRDFLFLLPVLLLFISLGRMAEIRPDTIGLLLFNLAWWQVLRGTGRTNILLAAALSGAALLFSARAAVMIVGMGLLLSLLCARKKDAVTFGYLVLMAVAFGAIVLLDYVSDPDRFLLIVQSVYFDPIRLMPDLSLTQRILSVDRFILVALIMVGLAAAVIERVRGKAGDSAIVVAIACLTQLVLIVVDPSPFQYVYGWSTLPVLAGIALLRRNSMPRLHAGLAVFSGALALSLVTLSIANSAAAGHPPRPGSILRLTYDAPFGTGELRQATTPRLLAMMISNERQQGLWNQLPLLSEICRRFRGPVLTKFYANPICLHDARYDWAGITWPPLLEGEDSAATSAEFEALFAAHPPELVAWGKLHYSPPLTPWGRAMLKDYAIYPGFALRREQVPRPK